MYEFLMRYFSSKFDIRKVFKKFIKEIYSKFISNIIFFSLLNFEKSISTKFSIELI